MSIRFQANLVYQLRRWQGHPRTWELLGNEEPAFLKLHDVFQQPDNQTLLQLPHTDHLTVTATFPQECPKPDKDDNPWIHLDLSSSDPHHPLPAITGALVSHNGLHSKAKTGERVLNSFLNHLGHESLKTALRESISTLSGPAQWFMFSKHCPQPLILPDVGTLSVESKPGRYWGAGLLKSWAPDIAKTLNTALSKQLALIPKARLEDMFSPPIRRTLHIKGIGTLTINPPEKSAKASG